MNNGAYVGDGGQAVIRHTPTGTSGTVERGGAKSRNGNPIFDLYANLNLDADEFSKTLDSVTAKVYTLTEAMERLSAALDEVNAKRHGMRSTQR